MIVALLCWYDERPAHLYECVRALGSCCHTVVAVDGAWELWPEGTPHSSNLEAEAIVQASLDADLGLLLHQPVGIWESEIAKRTAAFNLGRTVAGRYDWFLVVDSDEIAGTQDKAGLLDELDHCGDLVAQVDFATTWLASPFPVHHGIRRLYRNLPDLAVTGLHSIYVATHPDGGRVILNGDERLHEVEPAADLRHLLTLHHRKDIRDVDRDNRRGEYIRRREQARTERMPDLT